MSDKSYELGKFEREQGSLPDKDFNSETFDSDIAGVYEQHRKYSAYYNQQTVNSPAFARLPQAKRDEILARGVALSSLNKNIDHNERANLMFDTFADTQKENRGKTSEEMAGARAEYIKGYTYSTNAEERAKINNVAASPDLENLAATAKVRGGEKGAKLYNDLTKLRQSGKLRSEEGQNLVKELMALGQSLPEDQKFTATETAKRRVFQGGVADDSMVKTGAFGVEIKQADDTQFLSEFSAQFGRGVSDRNTKNQREEFAEALKNYDVQGLVDAELNRGIEMSTMPTDFVNKEESWWGSLTTIMEGVKELGKELVVGDNRRRTANDLVRGMFEDKNSLTGFIAGLGAAKAFNVVSGAAKYSAIAKKAKEVGEVAAKAKLSTRAAWFAGESVSSAIGGSLPVAMSEQEMSDRMQSGVKNYAFINTIIQDAVVGYPMDIAGSALKRMTWDPAVGVAKKVVGKKKQAKLDKKSTELKSALTSNPVESITQGLLESEAGIETKAKGDHILINIMKTPSLKGRSKPIPLADGSFEKMGGVESAEGQANLGKWYLDKMDRAYGIAGRELGDFEKIMFFKLDTEIAQNHYNGLGTAKDTYLTGIDTDIEIDKARKYIYETRTSEGNVYGLSDEYVPSRLITGVDTKALKVSLDAHAVRSNLTPDQAHTSFYNYSLNEQHYSALNVFYDRVSYSQEAFDRGMIFPTKLSTQKDAPLNLTGVVRKESIHSSKFMREQQARARALLDLDVSSAEVGSILNGIDANSIVHLPILPLMNSVNSRVQKIDLISDNNIASSLPMAELQVMKNNIADDANKINVLFESMNGSKDLKFVTAIREDIDARTKVLVDKINQIDVELDSHFEGDLGKTELGVQRQQMTDKLLQDEIDAVEAADLDGVVEVANSHGFTKAEVDDDLGMTLTHEGDKASAVIAEEASARRQEIDVESQTKSEPVLDEQGNPKEQPLPDTEETHKTIEGEEAARLAKEEAQKSMETDTKNVNKSEDYSEVEKLNHNLKAEYNPEQATPELAQAEAVSAISDAKADIPIGESVDIEVANGDMRISHQENGNISITRFDDNGNPIKEYIFQEDGKMLSDDGAKRAINPRLLKGLIGRKLRSEADVAEAFGMSPDNFSRHPKAAGPITEIINEYRSRVFELIDNTREGGFTDAKQMESMYREVQGLKAEAFKQVRQFAKEADLPTQSTMINLAGDKIRLVDGVSNSVNSFLKGLKETEFFKTNQAALGAYSQVQGKIQELLDAGSTNANALDVGVRSNIASKSRSVEAYLGNGDMPQAEGALKALFTDLKQYTRGYISNASEEVKMFGNKEKSKALIVNQRDVSSKNAVLEDNVFSRMMLDRNLGIPTLLSTDALVNKLYYHFVNASGASLHGNMTKMKGFGDLGGGVFWLDQDRPVRNMGGAEARIFSEIGAERSTIGTKMVNFRYKVEGTSNYKAQGDYDTMYGQVTMPITELARMMQDPDYTPNFYADLIGTHLAPVTDEKNPHIMNSVVELKKTFKDYQGTNLALHTKKEGSYLSKDIVNELFTREDGTFDVEKSYAIEFEAKMGENRVTLQAELKLMDMGSKKMPVVVETHNLKGAMGEDGKRLESRDVSYHYPLQGEIANITFLEAVDLQKLKGVNNGERVINARLKYEKNIAKTRRDVEVMDTNDSKVNPTHSDLPVTTTFGEAMDELATVQGAIQTGILDAQVNNPELSILYYGDAGKVMIPNLKNVWLRKGVSEAKDFVDRLSQGVQAADNGNANLKVFNLLAIDKSSSTINSKKNRGKTFLKDLLEDDVVVVAHKGADLPEDLHAALETRGVTYAGRSTQGDVTHSLYTPGKASNTAPFTGTQGLASAITESLRDVSKRAPQKALAKGEQRIDASVDGAYIRGDDTFVNMEGNQEFTSLASFEQAQAIVARHKADNPNSRLEYTIKISPNSKSQTVKSTKNPADLVPELRSNSRISINGKGMNLGELNRELFVKLADHLGILNEQVPDFVEAMTAIGGPKKTKGDIKEQLGIEVDAEGNIRGVAVLESSTMKFEKNGDYNVSVGDKAVSSKRYVVDARVGETLAGPLEVDDLIFKATNDNGIGTIGKFKGLLKNMQEVSDFLSTDVDDGGHKVNARSDAGVMLNDKNLQGMIVKFFQGGPTSSLLEIQDYFARLKEESSALGEEAGVRVDQASKEIMGVLLDGIEAKGLDKKLKEFTEQAKGKATESVMVGYTKSLGDKSFMTDADAVNGLGILSREGIAKSKLALRDSFQSALFPKTKNLSQKENRFLGSLSIGYSRNVYKLSEALVDANNKALTKNDHMIIADAAMDMIVEEVLRPNSINANKTAIAFLKGMSEQNMAGQQNLVNQSGFINGKTMLMLGAVGIVAGLAITKLHPVVFPSDGVMDEDDNVIATEGDMQMGFFSRNSSTTAIVGLIAGTMAYGKVARYHKKKNSGVISDGIKNAINRSEAVMHSYQENEYAGALGSTTLSMWFDSAERGTDRRKMGRALGIADNKAQMSTAQFSMVLDKTMNKAKTEADKAEMLVLIDELGKGTNNYGGTGMPVQERMVNAISDLEDKFEGRFSDEMIQAAKYPVYYLEETRNVGYRAELHDSNGELRTNYLITSNAVDKEAVINSFHIGTGLGFSKEKISALLDRAVLDANHKNYGFDEQQVASVLLNDYGAAGGEKFDGNLPNMKGLKRLLAEELHSRGPSGRSVDHYLNKLSYLPRTPAEISSYLSAQSGKGVQTNAEGAKLDIYMGESSSTKMGLLKSYDRLSKQVYYGEELQLDNPTILKGVYDDMPEKMRQEFFDNLRMDTGTNYLERVEAGAIKGGTDINQVEMANYSNNVALRNFQAYQAVSKLAWSPTQGIKEIIATNTQSAIVHGFGKHAKALVGDLMNDMDYETYTYLKHFQESVHSSKSDQGFSHGSRALVARFAENSKVPAYDLASNVMGHGKVGKKFKGLADHVLGGIFNKPIVVSNKLGALLNIEAGVEVPIKSLMQGHTGLSMMYRAANAAGAMTAYRLGKNSFEGIASRYKLNDEEGVTTSELGMLEAVLNDKELATLKTLDLSNKTDETLFNQMAMRYSIYGVQGSTGITQSSMKNLRASSGKYTRFMTTFKKAPATVFHFAWKHILMPAIEGDTAPLVRTMIASGLFAPYMISNVKGYLGQNESQDIALQERSAFMQSLTYHLSHMAMAIPFNNVLAAAGMVDDPDRGPTWKNAVRGVFGANAGTLLNAGGLGVDLARAGYNGATGERGSGEFAYNSATDFVESEIKPIREAGSFTRNAFNDKGVAFRSEKTGITGTIDMVKQNWKNKEFGEWDAYMPKVPAYLNTSSLAYDLFRKQAKRTMVGNPDPLGRELVNRAKVTKEEFNEQTGEGEFLKDITAKPVTAFRKADQKNRIDLVIKDYNKRGSSTK